MQQQDSTLYAFLKKNAAYSSGTHSRRASDFGTTAPEVDKNYSFNVPTHQNNFQHSSGQQYQSTLNNSNNMYGNNNANINMRRNDYKDNILVQESDDNHSVRSFNSNASSIRTTSSNF